MSSGVSGGSTDTRQERRFDDWQRQVSWAGRGINSRAKYCGSASKPANQQLFSLDLSDGQITRGAGQWFGAAMAQ